MYGLDSLGYLSIDGVKAMACDCNLDFCTGCFSGVYPMATPKEQTKYSFETKLSERSKEETR